MMTHGDGRVCCALCIEYVPPSDAVAVEIPETLDDDGDSDTTGICRRCAELVRDALDA